MNYDKIIMSKENSSCVGYRGYTPYILLGKILKNERKNKYGK